MKFYIPVTLRYVEFQTHSGITLWNVYNEDGTCANILWQNGESDLEVHELLSVGQILEVRKQVEAGTRDYDPYALFNKHMRRTKSDSH